MLIFFLNGDGLVPLFLTSRLQLEKDLSSCLPACLPCWMIRLGTKCVHYASKYIELKMFSLRAAVRFLCQSQAPKGLTEFFCFSRVFVFWMLIIAVFKFVFTPSPLKLIKCNKQWLNSVLLSPLIKFWALVVNYKGQNKCGFLVPFLWLFVIFLHFLRWNLPKLSQHIALSGIRIFNTNKVGFLQIFVLRDFPEKRAPSEVNYF